MEIVSRKTGQQWYQLDHAHSQDKTEDIGGVMRYVHIARMY